MTRREAGRLGGRKTVERHGREHMAAIGRLGFDALAAKLGFAGGGRRQALARLADAGRIRLPGPPDLTPDELTQLHQLVELEHHTHNTDGLPF